MAQEFKYRQIIRKDLAEDFAKTNCKQCHGRGLLEFHDIDMLSIRYEYCPCVKKRMKVYRSN